MPLEMRSGIGQEGGTVSDGRKTLGVLFADIADSTYLYKSLGDEGARDIVLRCLDQVARVVGAHGGKVIDRIGDELMCTLPTVAATAAAALDMQAAVTREIQSGSLPQRMSLRVGFHFGPVLTSGDQIFGDTVYTAKRVATLAKGHQIMTTGEMRHHLGPDLCRLLRFVARTAVKGKREVYDLYELVWNPTEVTDDEASLHRQPLPQSRLLLRYAEAEITLDESRPLFVIGRSAGCDLVIDDKGVSRFHAKIEYSMGRFILADLSTNGTLLENARGEITHLHRDECRLTGEGEIRVGTSSRVQRKHAIRYRLLPQGPPEA
jgi:class 3 adenylate cyclase